MRDRIGYVSLCALMFLPSIPREDFQDRREGLILRPTGFLPQARYGSPHDKPMFDVLQAIRTLSLTDEKNPAKRIGIFHFPSGEDLAGSHAEAARDSLEISEQCDFEFELGGLRFPRYQPKDGSTARNFLRRLTIEGAIRRYGRTAGRADFLRRALVKIQPEKVQEMLGEFVSAAKERGRTDAEVAAV